MKISDQVTRIRDLINASRKQALLFKEQEAWLRLCSSLDAIGDTDMAIDSFLSGEFPDDHGALYIMAYGILQVLYVQQNATSDLAKALDISLRHKDYPQLAHIRDVRSASIGHPTEKRRKGETPSFHFITRVSLHKNGFMLLSQRADGSTHWKPVVISDLISVQRDDLGQILKGVIEHLEAEEDRHRAEFRSEKLEDLLPMTLSYHFSKIGEATAGRPTCTGAGLGRVSTEVIRDALERFREALDRRGLGGTSDLAAAVDDIRYPLDEIDAFLRAVMEGEQPRLNEKLAYICVDFARRRIENLRKTAREIDEEYGESVRRQERPGE